MASARVIAVNTGTEADLVVGGKPAKPESAKPGWPEGLEYPEWPAGLERSVGLGGAG